ncbi:hypothetical protein BDV27DRAFT_163553 [Aspergillus caelatus]|uniref:ABC transporter domain-containing protein n=1 Tax=Aspergillus caelatus TaxID=61420 RepID=A0A5N6ZNP7_9EURO|nr:uncharacterized protein BDV27DRAFT_163553 [Aspergillus caelatus]KAE8358469.1 hypothetical protein BDV27DRAFT_163553 [Aspergillus caelatus]
MPAGHDTLIGPQGTRLSQGQRQRIAIAHAVYTRKPLALFDNVLSDLVRVTGRKAFDRVFSARGILRLIGLHYLPEAEFVIAYSEDGLEMGTFRELRLAKEYISDLDI